METLLNPYGLAEDGQLCNAQKAKKTFDYYCPACHEKMILRQGTEKVWHFAHPSNNCTSESYEHATAKKLIQEAIFFGNRFLKSHPWPKIKKRCALCEIPVIDYLPSNINNSIDEATINDFRVDVLLLSSDNPIMAIEIKHTHEVGIYKKENLGIPFLELLATDVICDPTLWRPIDQNLGDIYCGDCAKAVKKKGLIQYISNKSLAQQRIAFQLLEFFMGIEKSFPYFFIDHTKQFNYVDFMVNIHAKLPELLTKPGPIDHHHDQLPQ